MKAWLAIVLGLMTIAASAADWRDELSPIEPGKFPPLRPMRSSYKFGWTAFTSGDGEFVSSRGKPGELRLDVKAKTTGFVRTLFCLDAEHTAVARASTLRPLHVEQTEIYEDSTQKTTLAFGPDGVTRRREEIPPGRDAPKSKRFKFANTFDMHSALMWVRSQPLKPGDVYRIVVHAAAGAYLAEIEVLGGQKVSAGGRDYDALKLELKLRRINRDLEVEPYKKFKRAGAWISDDADRLLVKAEAEIFVGSIWAELQRVEFEPR